MTINFDNALAAHDIAVGRITNAADNGDWQFWGDPRVAFIDGAEWIQNHADNGDAATEADRRHQAGLTSTWANDRPQAFVDGAEWALTRNNDNNNQGHTMTDNATHKTPENAKIAARALMRSHPMFMDGEPGVEDEAYRFALEAARIVIDAIDG